MSLFKQATTGLFDSSFTLTLESINATGGPALFPTLIDLLNVRYSAIKEFLFYFLLRPLWGLLPFWSIGLIFQFHDHSQTVGILGRVIGSSQGLYLNTGHIKHP
jgi:hypothetical protein